MTCIYVTPAAKTSSRNVETAADRGPGSCTSVCSISYSTPYSMQSLAVISQCHKLNLLVLIASIDTCLHWRHSSLCFLKYPLCIEIYTLSRLDALFFFLEEHAPELHSPFPLVRRLLL